MEANDMSNTLDNPHHEVPFAQVGDDKIAALTKLAVIFKTNFKKLNLPDFQMHLPRPPKTKDLPF
jgi:hypothetical protein